MATKALGDKLRQNLARSEHRREQQLRKKNRESSLSLLRFIGQKIKEATKTIPIKLRESKRERSIYIKIVTHWDYVSFEKIKKLAAMKQLQKYCDNNKLKLELNHYRDCFTTDDVEYYGKSEIDNGYVLSAKISF